MKYDMKLLDGNKIADEQYELLKARVSDMERPPGLAVVFVGDDYASDLYVKLKEKAAKKAGIDFHKYLLEEDAREEEVLSCISFLREDDEVDGIIVQLPLPDQIDTDKIIAAIGPDKDADGFHADNISRYIDGEDVMEPVFPQALIMLAEESGQDLHGLQAAVVARSDLFSQAMVAACTRAGMRVHSISQDQLNSTKKVLSEMDVVFCACGVPGMIHGDDLKDGVIVVDGGISKVDDKTVGDVDFVSAAKKASYITPVPGGVGPVTIACLLGNVVDLAIKNNSR